MKSFYNIEIERLLIQQNTMYICLNFKHFGTHKMFKWGTGTFKIKNLFLQPPKKF